MTASVTIGIELVIIVALAIHALLYLWLYRQYLAMYKRASVGWDEALGFAKKAIEQRDESDAELLSIKSARSATTRRGNLTKSAKRRTKRDQVTAALRSSPVITIVQDDD